MSERPSWRDDPVAATTSFETMNPRSGASFRLTRVVEPRTGVLRIQPTRRALLLALAIAGIGAAVIAAGVADGGGLFTTAFGGLFVALGCYVYASMPPVTFDRRTGSYVRGWRAGTGSGTAARSDDNAGRLADVHAIQLLEHVVEGDDSDMTCYELNLVLRDGRRVKLTNHGDQQATRADGARIAQLVGVRLWDTTA